MRVFRVFLVPVGMSLRGAAGAIVVAVIRVRVVIRCERGRVADVLGRVFGRSLVFVMMVRVRAQRDPKIVARRGR